MQEDRDRQGDRKHQHGAQVAEEEEDNHGDQQQLLQQFAAHGTQGRQIRSERSYTGKIWTPRAIGA